ncbi:hypothetical protein AAVH_16033 [Aphelenchoides avenae]|nr:hypothetical protein AAVH_16033 [Aphelenchus avenae]
MHFETSLLDDLDWLPSDDAHCTYQPDDADLPSISPPLTVSKPSGTCHKCPVCGDAAWIKHFGSLSCNACASFFRRAVSYRKTYHCKNNGQCVLNYKSSRRMCQYCRFQACIRSGMQVNGVTKIHCEPSTAESLAKKLVQCRSATFVNRVNEYRRTLNRLSYSPHEPHRDALPTLASAANISEVSVLNEYVRTSGILEALAHSAMSHEAFMKPLKLSFFYTWLVHEYVTNTVRHSGQQCSTMYYTNDTILPVRDENVHDFYRRDEEILDPCPLARCAIEFSNEILHMAGVYHRAGLDEVEQCILLQLMLAKSADSFMGQERVRPYVDKLLNELNTHYAQTYNDSAVRFGNVILLMRDFQASHKPSLRHPFALNSHI